MLEINAESPFINAWEIVELDNSKKADLVSNLLVVLCADESAQPVLNTGSGNRCKCLYDARYDLAAKDKIIPSATPSNAANNTWY
jgi:hypothetical protein